MRGRNILHLCLIVIILALLQRACEVKAILLHSSLIEPVANNNPQSQICMLVKSLSSLCVEERLTLST